MSILQLSDDQQEAFDDIYEWYTYHQHSVPFLTLGGYAGTGKTTLMSYMYTKFNQSTIAYCAYTGKAASVLREKLNAHDMSIDMNCSVSTIHSLIYKPKLDGYGRVVDWHKKTNIDADLVIVDEASMVGKAVHDDLLSYGVPILYVGDHGQLPPVSEGFNLMESPMLKLETPHRFSENAPLIQISMMARVEGKIPYGEYGPTIKKIKKSQISDSDGPVDGFVKNTDMLTGKSIIICGFNKTRVNLNAKIRDYNEFHEFTPMIGDRVICLKNNKQANIPLYNGSHGTVRHMVKRRHIDYGNAVVEMDGLQEDMFRGKMTYRAFAQEKIDAFSMPQSQEVFDYGYVITAHKSQGSEFRRVMVIEEGKHIWAENWNRWLYTAVTRSQSDLLIVG